MSLTASIQGPSLKHCPWSYVHATALPVLTSATFYPQKPFLSTWTHYECSICGMVSFFPFLKLLSLHTNFKSLEDNYVILLEPQLLHGLKTFVR